MWPFRNVNFDDDDNNNNRNEGRRRKRFWNVGRLTKRNVSSSKQKGVKEDGATVKICAKWKKAWVTKYKVQKFFPAPLYIITSYLTVILHKIYITGLCFHSEDVTLVWSQCPSNSTLLTQLFCTLTCIYYRDFLLSMEVSKRWWNSRAHFPTCLKGMGKLVCLLFRPIISLKAVLNVRNS